MPAVVLPAVVRHYVSSNTVLVSACCVLDNGISAKSRTGTFESGNELQFAPPDSRHSVLEFRIVLLSRSSRLNKHACSRQILIDYTCITATATMNECGQLLRSAGLTIVGRQLDKRAL
jgi:hypothetical protein